MIRLHTHLKRMVNKAHVMCYSVGKVHEEIDKVLYKYDVRDKLPKRNQNGSNGTKGDHRVTKSKKGKQKKSQGRIDAARTSGS